MRELAAKIKQIPDEDRCKQLDTLQEEALRSLRENTAKMKSKIKEATERIQPIIANVSR